jgi:predicted dienelactone hydrolase
LTSTVSATQADPPPFPSAGVCRMEILDRVADGESSRFPLILMYPAAAEAVPVKLGQYTALLAADAPIAPGKHRLVVISHGSGGTPLTHRLLAATLARHGNVVALIEHPGNHRNDNRLEDALENFEGRPRHVSAAVDAIFADTRFGPHVSRSGFSIVGHSMGGYTALAVAGGAPRKPPRTESRVAVKADPRVRSLVLLNPATPWYFGEGTLTHVTVPILMFTAGKDPYTPSWHGDIVAQGIPDRKALTHRHVPGAGHFSFLSPFPESAKKQGLPPALDPPGFDREAFQPELARQILEFLGTAP